MFFLCYDVNGACVQDYTLIDHLAAFDRERIPERVVHAKGAGAFGHFEVKIIKHVLIPVA